MMKNLIRMIIALVFILSISVYADIMVLEDGTIIERDKNGNIIAETKAGGALIDGCKDFSNPDFMMDFINDMLDWDKDGVMDPVAVIEACDGDIGDMLDGYIKMSETGEFSLPELEAYLKSQGFDILKSSTNINDIYSGKADFLLLAGVSIRDATAVLGAGWDGTQIDNNRAMYARLDTNIDRERLDRFGEAFSEANPNPACSMAVNLELSNKYPNYGEIVYGYINGTIKKRSVSGNVITGKTTTYSSSTAGDSCPPKDTRANDSNTQAFAFVDDLPISSGIYWDQENSRWVVPIDTKYVYNAPRISGVSIDPDIKTILTKGASSYLMWQERKAVAPNDISGCNSVQGCNYLSYRGNDDGENDAGLTCYIERSGKALVLCIIAHQYMNKATISFRVWDPQANDLTTKVLDNESKPFCTPSCQPMTFPKQGFACSCTYESSQPGVKLFNIIAEDRDGYRTETAGYAIMVKEIFIEDVFYKKQGCFPDGTDPDGKLNVSFSANVTDTANRPVNVNVCNDAQCTIKYCSMTCRGKCTKTETKCTKTEKQCVRYITRNEEDYCVEWKNVCVKSYTNCTAYADTPWYQDAECSCSARLSGNIDKFIIVAENEYDKDSYSKKDISLKCYCGDGLVTKGEECDSGPSGYSQSDCGITGLNQACVDCRCPENERGRDKSKSGEYIVQPKQKEDMYIDIDSQNPDFLIATPKENYFLVNISENYITGLATGNTTANRTPFNVTAKLISLEYQVSGSDEETYWLSMVPVSGGSNFRIDIMYPGLGKGRARWIATTSDIEDAINAIYSTYSSYKTRCACDSLWSCMKKRAQGC